MVSARSLFGDDAVILRERDFRLLLVANIVAPLGTVVVSPVLDSLLGPFGTTAANIGLMISVFTAPAIVMIPVVGVLADRYGRKPILVSGLLLLGTAGTAIAFTTDFRVVLGLRLLQGIGFAGVVPIIITSIGDLYTGSREATGQGLRFMVSGLSGTVFPFLSGVLVVIAWQYPFLLYATALPAAAAVYRWFEEPTDSDGGVAGQGLEAYRTELFRLIRHRRVLALVVARGLPLVIWFAFITYNSIIVVRLLDGTAPQAGLLAAVGNLVYALAGSQAGRITAWFDTRLHPLVGGNVLLGSGFALVLFAPTLPVAIGGIAIAGVGFGVVLALYRSIITGLPPESLRAGLVSLSESGGRVIATVTPIAMGAAIAAIRPTAGLASAIQLVGLGATVVSIGGGLVCLLIARTAPPMPHRVESGG